MLNFTAAPITTSQLQYVWLKGGYPQPLLATSEYDICNGWRTIKPLILIEILLRFSLN